MERKEVEQERCQGYRGILGRDGVNDIKEPSIGCEIHIVYVAT